MKDEIIKKEDSDKKDQAKETTITLDEIKAGIHKMEDALAMTARTAGLVIEWYPLVIRKMIGRNGSIEMEGTANGTLEEMEQKSKEEDQKDE